MKTAVDLLEHKPQDETWEHPKGIYYRKTGMDPQGKVVALFSGQGSQYLEMTRDLTMNFPPMRQAFSEMDSLFVKDGLKPISSRVFPPPVFEKERRDALSDTLTQTEHAQPAIGVVSQGLYRLLQQAGLKPDFAAGHSFGELTALWAAGVLSDSDYAFLAKSRGKAMAAPKDSNFDSGTMLAVKGNAGQVAEEIKQFPEITLANWNSDEQVVLAGSKPAIQQVQQYLAEKGYSVVPLPVSAAFHTPLVGHAQKPFAAAINSVTFQAPKLRLYSNTSGKAYSNDPDEIRQVLKGHILQPVLFRDEINAIYSDGGTFFIEFGPKNILTNLVKNILGERPHFAVALNANAKKDSDRQFREAILQMRVAGLNLGHVDPYQAPMRKRAARKLSPVTVKLNGGAYVSPKTTAAFEAALHDGFKISMPVSQKQAASPVLPLNKMTNTQPAPTSVPAVSTGVAAMIEIEQRPVSNNSNNDPALAAQLESNLAQYREHQSEIVRLHEQYLRNEEASAAIFAKLSELEIGLVSKADPAKMDQIVSVIEGLERSMARFHDHQAETLRVHQQYLKSQEDFSQTFIKLVQQQVEPVQGSRVSIAAVEQPKVEKPLQRAFTLPPANLDRFAQQEIIAPAPQIQNHVPVARIPENGNGSKPAPAVKVESSIAPTVAPVQKNAAPAYSFEALTKALLQVVSEKTGYPVEMLELDTDMEADLGIDSIKRVEIMGEMRSQFPNLPKADPEAFADMRTLGQTVEYMAARKADPVIDNAPVMPANLVDAAAPASASPTSPAPAGNYSQAVLAEALLNVVSEKTGYPVEMLEMDTDMEADLGINSIKRVEIMGEMRNRFPNLPAANPEAFAEMRTLGQTVQYMSSSASNSQPCY